MKFNTRSKNFWFAVIIAIIGLLLMTVLIIGALFAPETSVAVLPVEESTQEVAEMASPITEPTQEIVGAASSTGEATAETTQLPDVTAEATQEVACLPRATGSGCLRLPTFSGQSMAGAEITFPDVFSTEYVLVLIVFSRGQQETAEPWLPVMQELVNAHSNLSFYDLPLVTDIAPAARVMALMGTSAMIDSQWHEEVVMAFLENRDEFVAAMDIPADHSIPQMFIMNTQGEVLWRMDGDFTEEHAAALRQQVASMID